MEDSESVAFSGSSAQLLILHGLALPARSGHELVQHLENRRTFLPLDTLIRILRKGSGHGVRIAALEKNHILWLITIALFDGVINAILAGYALKILDGRVVDFNGTGSLVLLQKLLDSLLSMGRYIPPRVVSHMCQQLLRRTFERTAGQLAAIDDQHDRFHFNIFLQYQSLLSDAAGMERGVSGGNKKAVKQVTHWVHPLCQKFLVYFPANVMYDISRKGSDSVTQFEQLDHLFAANGGILKTAHVVSANISKPILYDYIKERGVEQAAHGVYISADAWTDAMYLLHLRCSQAVFSHETALFFHDLTDREPAQYAITVRTGYNPSALKSDGVQVYTIKRDLHEVGVTMMKTSFGHDVPVYDMERTICDIVRSRSNVEMQTFQNALKQYAHRKDKDLRKLMHYAALLRVEKTLRQYMEVLL